MTARDIIKQNVHLFINKYDIRYGRKTGKLKFFKVTYRDHKTMHNGYRYTANDVDVWIKNIRPNFHEMVARLLGEK
jgi:hypothetical protein